MESQKRAISPEFKQLVAQQHRQLHSFVRTLGVDPDWVDDLAQEVFLVAWRERDSFDSQRDIGKWLRGIVVFMIIVTGMQMQCVAQELTTSATKTLEEMKADGALRSSYRKPIPQTSTFETSQANLKAFHEEIKPKLKEACFDCHGSETAEGDLRVEAEWSWPRECVCTGDRVALYDPGLAAQRHRRGSRSEDGVF